MHAATLGDRTCRRFVARLVRLGVPWNASASVSSPNLVRAQNDVVVPGDMESRLIVARLT